MNKEEILYCSNFVSFGGKEERQKKGWALSNKRLRRFCLLFKTHNEYLLFCINCEKGSGCKGVIREMFENFWFLISAQSFWTIINVAWAWCLNYAWQSKENNSSAKRDLKWKKNENMHLRFYRALYCNFYWFWRQLLAICPNCVIFCVFPHKYYPWCGEINQLNYKSCHGYQKSSYFSVFQLILRSLILIWALRISCSIPRTAKSSEWFRVNITSPTRYKIPGKTKVLLKCEW